MILIAFATSFFATTAGIYFLVPFTHKLGLTDSPDIRKNHVGVIPLIGGIAIYTTVTVAALLFIDLSQELLLLLISCGFIVFTGALDDKYNINFRIRLIVQSIASLVMIFGVGIKISSLGNLFGLGDVELGILTVPITVLAYLTIINAFNLIDGMDGLAGGLSFVSFFTLSLLVGARVSDSTQLILALFMGSLASYLIFNLNLIPRHLPKVFLGDAGSTLLGFAICTFLIRYTQDKKAIIEPVTAIWFVAIPLFDMLTTVFRRIKHKKSPFKPDRTHIHHILLQFFRKKVKKTVFFISLMQILFSLVGLLLALNTEVLNNSIASVVSLVGFLGITLLFHMIFTGMHKKQVLLNRLAQRKEKRKRLKTG